MSLRHLALLAIGVAAVSLSSILLRLADAPPLAAAFYRNAIAAAILFPLAFARHREEIRSLTRRQWGIATLAGALLALHFATWIPSLSYTTVAASTVLVTSQPVWVALIARVLGDRVTRSAVVGIGLSLVGAAIISGGDFGVSSRAAFGDLLAIAGAVTAAGYFLSGRNLRQELALVPYVSICYTTCAALLAGAMLVSSTPFSGYDGKVWLLFVLMAIVPQIMGHTVFNYLLAEVEAAVVAIAVTAEPVGASLLALALFHEVPRWTAFIGGAVILAGIYVTIAAQTRREVVAPIE